MKRLKWLDVKAGEFDGGVHSLSLLANLKSIQHGNDLAPDYK